MSITAKISSESLLDERCLSLETTRNNNLELETYGLINLRKKRPRNFTKGYLNNNLFRNKIESLCKICK